MFMENVMTTEDEERMMYYARVSFEQQRQTQTTLEIIENFLLYIMMFGGGAIAYAMTESEIRTFAAILVIGVLGYYFSKLQHSDRKTKYIDM